MEHFEIQGMTCQNCVKKVTAALQAAGIEGEVTLNPPAVMRESIHIFLALVTLAKVGRYLVLDAVILTWPNPAKQPFQFSANQL